MNEQKMNSNKKKLKKTKRDLITKQQKIIFFCSKIVD